MKHFLLYLILFVAVPALGQQEQWQDTMGRIEYDVQVCDSTDIKIIGGNGVFVSQTDSIITITRTPNFIKVLDTSVGDPNFYIRIDTGWYVRSTPQPDLNIPTTKPYQWKRGAVAAGFGLVAGMAYALNQMSAHHPNDLPSGWNRQFWDNSLSHTNKYKNHDKLQGPKFPLSTSALVFVTDGYHLTSTVHKAAILGAGITIGFGQKRPWWHYACDAVLGFAAYSIGFHSVYTYQMLGK